MRYENTAGSFFVMLDITSACNYKCLHCYNNSGKKAEDELTDEEIMDIARQIAEMHPKTVCLCGGETMLRSNILDIIKVLAPEVGAVNMVTNGSLINETKVKQLQDAGINAIQISLDGINEMQHDTFRGHTGAYKKAIDAITTIHKLGIEVFISFIPNKLNHRTILDFFELVYGLGVSSARIMPLIPMGRGSAIDSLMLNSEEYIALQLAIEANKGKYINKGMNIEWGDPLDHMRRMPNNEGEGFKSLQIEIKSNGNLTVSSYLPVVVGNLRKHTLKEYWERGYNTIWYNEKMKTYLRQIETLYDINRLEPKPYSGDYYYLDIIKDENHTVLAAQ